ncbi:hypothetical protein N7520_008603 [Penicillium odoratum]|uniref:uncharacterized protein n=1 Tax=Penicillium odoratum TaxID=1167516 RepID=UPI0025495BBA|nr:uncharacterized protein N7520_008603 [Penicillium odoratum]KAJ5751686.1 hypothetical protein N7520_008603 [Penicillium odoratum]
MWTSQHDDFDAFYRSLSPASEIHIENIDINIREMRFSIKSSRVERFLTTVERLKASYKHLGYSVVLPPIVSLDQLRIVRQINDTVSLVELPVGYEPRLVIMKSATGTADSLYHELQILLSLDKHPNLCGRPMGLIVYQSCPTMEPLVFGFILQFYSGGSLARALCPHSHFKPIGWQEKVKWAKQLAKTLCDLRLKQGIIYGDLKAENVVLSSSIPNSRDLVLIDFEQRGTADAWTPPEIIMMQRLYSVIMTCEDPVVQAKSAQLLSLALEEPIPNPVQHYQRMKGRSRNFWYRLRSLEQDAAMVFMLGKLLYCIFENVGTVTHLIVPSHPGESNPQFPRFVISPPKIQQLVTKCTRGAREYETSSPFILRVGNKLVSRGMSGVEGEPMGTPADTIRAARHYWINSLDSSEQFVMARERYRQGKATPNDLDLLAYLQRPCLKELLRALDGIK